MTHFHAHVVSMNGCVGVGACVIASTDGYGITNTDAYVNASVAVYVIVISYLFAGVFVAAYMVACLNAEVDVYVSVNVTGTVCVDVDVVTNMAVYMGKTARYLANIVKIVFWWPFSAFLVLFPFWCTVGALT